MTPAHIAKAARLTVVERADGSYQVAGDHGTYVVRFSPFTNRFFCDCRAASSAVCTHLTAVRFHQERRQQKAG